MWMLCEFCDSGLLRLRGTTRQPAPGRSVTADAWKLEQTADSCRLADALRQQADEDAWPRQCTSAAGAW